MSGYDVVISSMFDAAEAADSAADQLAKVDPGGKLVSAVGSALPGASESTGAAGALREAWQGRGRELADGMRGFGDALRSAAERYAASEATAGEELDPSIDDRPTGGPKAV